MGNDLRVLRYTLIVSLGGFIFGFDASVISGTLNYVVREFGLNEWQQGLVVSAPTMGAMLSVMVAGMICDAIGRRRMLLAIALLYLFSAMLSALAPSFALLVTARFVGGLAFASLMIAPLYIAEISPAAYRGKMVSVNQLNIMLGFSAAYFANYYFLQLSQSQQDWVVALHLHDATWRWMLGIEVVPAALYCLALLTVPESPRWLLLQQRVQQAHLVFTHLRQGTTDNEQEWQQMHQSVQTQQPSLKRRLAWLIHPAMRYALLIGLIVGITQQITGINAVYFYAPSIFEQSGIGTNAAFIQAIWIGIINIVFTLLAMLLIDRLGRKPLLIIGLAGVAISMALCAYGFKQATYHLDEPALAQLPATVQVEQLRPMLGHTYHSDVAFKQALQQHLGEHSSRTHQSALIQAAVKMNAKLILLGILGFVAAFAFSLGPVMWVMFSEIFPNHVRGIAISAVGCINSVVSFIVQLTFPWELANLGAAPTFLIYAVFAVLGLILVVRLFPETKGQSLEQLAQQLTDTSSSPPSSAGQPAASVEKPL